MTNIGVFDSGLGGLTVLNELAKKKPANYYYLGDSKRAPYGSRDSSEIINFADEIVRFLEKYDIDQYVIACNTISVLATDYLAKKYDKDFIPITQAGIESAKDYDGSFLVLGTDTTINSHYYKDKLSEIKDNKIYEMAASELAGLIEKGETKGELLDYYLNKYLKLANDKKISNILLACTHYPIIENAIKENLNYEARIINPATNIAHNISNTSNDSLKVKIYMTELGKESKRIIDEIMKVPYDLELKEI